MLLQIIAEHEQDGQPMLSTHLLSQIIRFYGDSLQGFMGNYLERACRSFLEQQQQFRQQLSSLLGQSPWAMMNQLTERNLELWKGLQQNAGRRRRQPSSRARRASRATSDALPPTRRVAEFAARVQASASPSSPAASAGSAPNLQITRPAGRRVIAADLARASERVAHSAQEIAGLDIHFEPLDVADFDACGALVRKVEAEHGPLDILVNAAGITRDVTLRKMDTVQWDDVMRVNLDGVFNMCRHVVDGMATRGFGRIVNISSVNGQTGQFGQTNYSAAKAGMHGFTMALAREVARKGVTVNTVSPGYCDTAMVMAMPEDMRAGSSRSIPVGRLGEPGEIARTVEFLTADDAGFITGANIPVNGGLFMGF